MFKKILLAEKNKTKSKKDYVRPLHVLIILVPVIKGVDLVKNLRRRFLVDHALVLVD